MQNFIFTAFFDHIYHGWTTTLYILTLHK